MSMIVAGNFSIKAEVDSAIEALLSGGILADHICSFAVNPPGQHAARPAGVLVAVDAPIAADRAFATDLLRKRGARDVEEAEGTWRDGTWIDSIQCPINPQHKGPAGRVLPIGPDEINVEAVLTKRNSFFDRHQRICSDQARRVGKMGDRRSPFFMP